MKTYLKIANRFTLVYLLLAALICLIFGLNLQNADHINHRHQQDLAAIEQKYQDEIKQIDAEKAPNLDQANMSKEEKQRILKQFNKVQAHEKQRSLQKFQAQIQNLDAFHNTCLLQLKKRNQIMTYLLIFLPVLTAPLAWLCALMTTFQIKLFLFLIRFMDHWNEKMS